MWNGPDRCCRTCHTWSEWWYWFCRQTGLPKTPACILIKPIPEPSFSVWFPIYLHYCYSTTTPRFFEFRASKSGISYRITTLSWAEFLYRKVRVCFFVHEMGMVSSLGCEFAIATMLSLFRTFLFGFYNFIWGIHNFGNSDFVWVQLNERFDQCVNLVVIWFDFTNLVLEICWKKLGDLLFYKLFIEK